MAETKSLRYGRLALGVAIAGLGAAMMILPGFGLPVEVASRAPWWGEFAFAGGLIVFGMALAYSAVTLRNVKSLSESLGGLLRIVRFGKKSASAIGVRRGKDDFEDTP